MSKRASEWIEVLPSDPKCHAHVMTRGRLLKTMSPLFDPLPNPNAHFVCIDDIPYFFPNAGYVNCI